MAKNLDVDVEPVACNVICSACRQASDHFRPSCGYALDRAAIMRKFVKVLALPAFEWVRARSGRDHAKFVKVFTIGIGTGLATGPPPQIRTCAIDASGSSDVSG